MQTTHNSRLLNPNEMKRQQADYESETRSLKQSKLLVYIINMIFFAFSIIMLVVGILYLSGFRYDYSFTRFSTTLVAALFISFGVIILLCSVLNAVSIHMNKKMFIVMVSSCVILILFLTLLAIGIWGLAVSADENTLSEEIKLGLVDAIKRYDERNPYRYETKQVDWLQQRFNCCGINSYSDWRSFYIYGDKFDTVNFVDTWSVNQNLPYIDHVPDSCCIRMSYNCGKQYYNNYAPNSMNRNMILNLKGCLGSFQQYFTKDIVFLAALTVALSGIAILAWGVLVFAFILNRN